jgi:MFS family permease
MTLMGVVQNLYGLCATRFFLGFFEAGFFPGATFLVGQWYPPEQTQFRMALFYCSASISGAFSGLLAAAIAKMNGIAGQEGWRYIFILEGLATVLLGVAAFWLLPDSPEHAIGHWLTEEEARFLRLNHIVTRGIKTVESQPETDRRTKILQLEVNLDRSPRLANLSPSCYMGFRHCTRLWTEILTATDTQEHGPYVDECAAT